MAMLIGFGVFLGVLVKLDDYKDGQVDAMTGNIKYKLQTNTDKTVEWVKIKK